MLGAVFSVHQNQEVQHNSKFPGFVGARWTDLHVYGLSKKVSVKTRYAAVPSSPEHRSHFISDLYFWNRIVLSRGRESTNFKRLAVVFIDTLPMDSILSEVIQDPFDVYTLTRYLARLRASLMVVLPNNLFYDRFVHTPLSNKFGSMPIHLNQEIPSLIVNKCYRA
jgi:hypothetical protein